jgi:hypothetical protein
MLTRGMWSNLHEYFIGITSPRPNTACMAAAQRLRQALETQMKQAEAQAEPQRSVTATIELDSPREMGDYLPTLHELRSSRDTRSIVEWRVWEQDGPCTCKTMECGEDLGMISHKKPVLSVTMTRTT